MRPELGGNMNIIYSDRDFDRQMTELRDYTANLENDAEALKDELSSVAEKYTRERKQRKRLEDKSNALEEEYEKINELDYFV